jgi:hypothetical protein
MCAEVPSAGIRTPNMVTGVGAGASFQLSEDLIEANMLGVGVEKRFVGCWKLLSQNRGDLQIRLTGVGSLRLSRHRCRIRGHCC